MATARWYRACRSSKERWDLRCFVDQCAGDKPRTRRIYHKNLLRKQRFMETNERFPRLPGHRKVCRFTVHKMSNMAFAKPRHLSARKPKPENELYFTGVIERMFIILKENRPKRKYKDVISVSRFIDVLQHYCQALCESDFFSTEAQSLKHKDKRLVKYGRGKWKIICGEMKK